MDQLHVVLPVTASKVRLMMCSLACVSTWTVTSSGIMSSFDQGAHELVLCLRCRRESDFDLFESHIDQVSGRIPAFLPDSSARSVPGFHHAGQRCTRSAVRLHNLFSPNHMSNFGGIKYCLSYFLQFSILFLSFYLIGKGGICFFFCSYEKTRNFS